MRTVALAVTLLVALEQEQAALAA
jgi:hypothetical protein